jgi:hypothetical protein
VGSQTQSLDEKISYYESPVYAVRKKIEEKGYIAARAGRCVYLEPANEEIGIYKRRAPVRGFLGFMHKQRALYIGSLFFNNDERNAIPDENWVLEVYGREHVKELTELAKDISAPYKVNVQIRLEKEESEEALYPGDFCT